MMPIAVKSPCALCQISFAGRSATYIQEFWQLVQQLHIRAHIDGRRIAFGFGHVRQQNLCPGTAERVHATVRHDVYFGALSYLCI
jgi:hypothetical protein